MEVAKYELTFVLDAQMDQEEIDKFVDLIEKKILDEKGEIFQKEHWGKRRLAYEIKRKQYGYYVYFLFAAVGSSIQSIERDLKMNESVLRFLTVKLDKQAQKFVERKLKKEEEEKAAKAEEEAAAKKTEAVEAEDEAAEKEPAEKEKT